MTKNKKFNHEAKTKMHDTRCRIHENSQQFSVHGPQKLKPHRTFNHEEHEEKQHQTQLISLVIASDQRERGNLNFFKMI
jgi:hypothetical protein